MRKTELEKLKADLLGFLKKAAFVREKIVLSSGKTSDYYIDGRLVTLSAKGAYLSAAVILELIRDEDIQAIGGPTIGADPIVGAIAALSFVNKCPINTFLVRKTPKTHGKMKQIEGPVLKTGSKVILIDDVATSGKSLIEAIRLLRQEQIEVKKAIVLIDRQEGARENLEKENCRLEVIFKSSDFLNE